MDRSRLRDSLLLLACAAGTGCHRSVIPEQRRIAIRSESGDTTIPCDRLIRLQTTERARLAEVSSAVVDPETRELLVADLAGTKQVYRFSATGEFIVSYGTLQSGRPSREPLRGFASGPHSSVYLFFDDLIALYRRDGRTERHVPAGTSFAPVRVGSSVCAYSPRKTGGQKTGHVTCYDEDLRPTPAFHPGDPRLRRYTYIPNPPMASVGDLIFVAESYDPRLTAYHLDGTALFSLWLESKDTTTPDLWRKPSLTGQDRASIFHGTHHFAKVFGTSDSLFVYEQHQPSGLGRYLTLDHNTGAAIALGRLDCTAPWLSEGNQPLPVIIGSYADGLIGAINDFGLLRARTRYLPAALQGPALSDTDNPLIVLLPTGGIRMK